MQRQNYFAKPIEYLKQMKLLSFSFYHVVKNLTENKIV